MKNIKIGKISKIVNIALVAAVALGTSGCYMSTVDQGEVGVEVNAGKVTEKYVSEGFHFSLNPLADLYIMNAKSKQLVFTAAEQNKEDTSEAMYSRPVSVITSEKLTVPIDVSVLYSLKKSRAVSTYAEYGIDTVWEDKVIVKKARSIIRDAIGKASVYELNDKRGIFQKIIMNQLVEQLGDRINVAQVNIMNIPLPQKIKEEIEATMIEAQAATKETFKLKKVQTQALIAKAKAKGQADGQREIAKTITPELLEYKRLENERLRIEKWNGVMPTTNVNGQSGMLLNLK